MLTEPLIQQLHTLRLKGMASALEQQRAAPDLTDRSFEDRLGLMIQQELSERAGYRLAQRLRWAKLPMPACVEDLDTRAPRGLDPAQLAQVIDLGWIREHLNVLLTGPTGVGKSYLAAALAHAACRADFAVRCFRLPWLVEELARYGALQKRSALFRQLAKADLLVLDDFGLAPLAVARLPRRPHRCRCHPRSAGPQQLSTGAQGRVDAPAQDRQRETVGHLTYQGALTKSSATTTVHSPLHHRPGIRRNHGRLGPERWPGFAGIRSRRKARAG